MVKVKSLASDAKLFRFWIFTAMPVQGPRRASTCGKVCGTTLFSNSQQFLSVLSDFVKAQGLEVSDMTIRSSPKVVLNSEGPVRFPKLRTLVHIAYRNILFAVLAWKFAWVAVAPEVRPEIPSTLDIRPRIEDGSFQGFGSSNKRGGGRRSEGSERLYWKLFERLKNYLNKIPRCFLAAHKSCTEILTQK